MLCDCSSCLQSEQRLKAGAVGGVAVGSPAALVVGEYFEGAARIRLVLTLAELHRRAGDRSVRVDDTVGRLEVANDGVVTFSPDF